jgi:hypothetical protein
MCKNQTTPAIFAGVAALQKTLPERRRTPTSADVLRTSSASTEQRSAIAIGPSPLLSTVFLLAKSVRKD